MARSIVALSKTQTKRLGGLLTIMFGDEIPADVLQILIKDELVVSDNGLFKLSAKGLDEKNRLCTLAGLNISYQSEQRDTAHKKSL